MGSDASTGMVFWSRVIDFGNGEANNNVALALSDATSGKPYFAVLRETGVQFVSSPVALPTNQWSHLAVTFRQWDGVKPNATLFVNGVSVATGFIHNPNTPTRTNNFIGRSNWPADSTADGLFDNVRIWNTPLSPATLRTWMS